MLVMISMIIFALVHNFCRASPIDQNGGDDASDYLCAAPPIDPIISHPSPKIPPRAVPPSTHTGVQDILDRILDIVFNRDGRPVPRGTLPAGKGGFPAPPRAVGRGGVPAP